MFGAARPLFFCSTACVAPSVRSRSLFYPTHTSDPQPSTSAILSLTRPSRTRRSPPAEGLGTAPALPIWFCWYPGGSSRVGLAWTWQKFRNLARRADGLICSVPPVATHPLSQIPPIRSVAAQFGCVSAALGAPSGHREPPRNYTCPKLKVSRGRNTDRTGHVAGWTMVQKLFRLIRREPLLTRCSSLFFVWSKQFQACWDMSGTYSLRYTQRDILDCDATRKRTTAAIRR